MPKRTLFMTGALAAGMLFTTMAQAQWTPAEKAAYDRYGAWARSKGTTVEPNQVAAQDMVKWKRPDGVEVMTSLGRLSGACDVSAPKSVVTIRTYPGEIADNRHVNKDYPTTDVAWKQGTFCLGVRVFGKAGSYSRDEVADVANELSAIIDGVEPPTRIPVRKDPPAG